MIGHGGSSCVGSRRAAGDVRFATEGGRSAPPPDDRQNHAEPTILAVGIHLFNANRSSGRPAMFANSSLRVISWNHTFGAGVNATLDDEAAGRAGEIVALLADQPQRKLMQLSPIRNDLARTPEWIDAWSGESPLASNQHPVLSWFGQAPLAWLFCAATVILDVALWRHRVDVWVIVGAALAQISVAVTAAYRGQSHRLARASLVVAMLAFLRLLSLDQAKSSDAAPTVFFTHLVVYAAMLSAMFGCCELVAAARRWRRGSLRWPRPRFSVAELLAWMIIVAVASTLLRCSFDLRWDRIHAAELLLLTAGPTAVFAVASVRNCSVAGSAAAALIAISAATYFIHPPHLRVWMLQAGVSAYLLSWNTVCRLDQQFHWAPTSPSEVDGGWIASRREKQPAGRLGR